MAEKQGAEVARRAKLRYWGEADARVVVDAWRESGETQAAFARRHALHNKRLSWWIRRLERSGASEPKPERVRFHPVRVLERTSTAAEGGDDRIEIRLGDGRSVHVPAKFAPAALREVLQVLERSA